MDIIPFVLLTLCFLVLIYFRKKAGKELIEEYFIDSQTLFRLLLPAFLTLVPTYIYLVHINNDSMRSLVYEFAASYNGFSLQMLTVPFIHFNFTHLIINLLLLAFILPYAVARFSVLKLYLTIFLVSVASAIPMHFFSAWAYPYYSGASAGIIAIYSFVGTYFLLTAQTHQYKWLGCLLLSAGLLQCMGAMVLNAKSANAAHWFGFFAGAMIAQVLYLLDNKRLIQQQAD